MMKLVYRLTTTMGVVYLERHLAIHKKVCGSQDSHKSFCVSHTGFGCPQNIQDMKGVGHGQA